MSEFLDAYYPNQYMGESIERDDELDDDQLDVFEDFGEYDYRLTD